MFIETQFQSRKTLVLLKHPRLGHNKALQTAVPYVDVPAAVCCDSVSCSQTVQTSTRTPLRGAAAIKLLMSTHSWILSDVLLLWSTSSTPTCSPG